VNLRVVSTDPGNGYTKACSSTGTVIFPSIVGQAVDASFQGLGEMDGIVIQDNGRTYFVGDLARKQSRFKAAVLDRSRLGSDFYRILFRAAIGQVVLQNSRLRVVTQLPVNWYSDRDELDALLGQHEVILNGRRRVYEVEQILKVPDGFGALCSMLLNAQSRVKDHNLEAGRVGVIDLGSRTTSFTMYDGMVFIPTASGSVDTGLVKLWQAVQADLSAEFREEFSLHEVDQALRAGEIRIGGEAYPVGGTVHAQAMAEELRSFGQTLWGRGLRLDRILLSGGGCLVPELLKALTGLMKHAQPVDDPVTANARGNYLFGSIPEVWRQ